MEPGVRTIILYHGNCPDGFGGAYAAWKKFGDDATYIPLKHGGEVPEGLTGTHVYFIDFCYPQETMDRIKATAASLTVLDHHEGVQEVAESMPESVFDANRSGATIAWSYFHPDAPVPMLLKLVEDDDLFRFQLPDTKALMAYLPLQPYEFPLWDRFARALDNPSERDHFLERARIYREYFDLLVDLSVQHAKLVSFEGHTIYVGESHPMKPMSSAVGNTLARKRGPFSLVIHARRSGLGVSIRGDGSIDVANIAQKYGGNGHPNSSGFFLPYDAPMPWTPVDDEDSRD